MCAKTSFTFANSVGLVKTFSLKKPHKTKTKNPQTKQQQQKPKPKQKKTNPKTNTKPQTKPNQKNLPKPNPQLYFLNPFWHSSVMVISSSVQRMTQVFQIRREGKGTLYDKYLLAVTCDHTKAE